MSEPKGTYTTKPTLTALDLAVIIDTLSGSLSLKDNGAIFHFTADARNKTMAEVVALMRSLNVAIAIVEPYTVTVPGNNNPIVVMEAEDEGLQET